MKTWNTVQFYLEFYNEKCHGPLQRYCKEKCKKIYVVFKISALKKKNKKERKHNKNVWKICELDYMLILLLQLLLIIILAFFFQWVGFQAGRH